MAIFKVIDVDGNEVVVTDLSKKLVNGLTIIGDGSVDWNEPIMKNIVALSSETIRNQRSLLSIDNRVTSNEHSISVLEAKILELTLRIEDLEGSLTAIAAEL